MKKLKRFIKRPLLLILLLLTSLVAEAKPPTTVKQQMDYLHKTHHMNFVYDADIDVERPYYGPNISGMKLTDALRNVFQGTDIDWEVQGRYVLLHKREIKVQQKRVQQRHTLSGFVRDGNGESLINATVFDLTTRQGTTSNEYGFFSLTLPEGSHHIRISYIGFDDRIENVLLTADKWITVQLKENARLTEVVVTGDMNSPLLNTQTGKRSFSTHDIKTEFSLLSSPDVVKTLQKVSGVSAGVELMSGLYVHGGSDDENLYMIDGTPLYQTNHLLGLFSSFNVDVMKNVDFYKSGFPARYGGRLSSVVDARTNDGDMHKVHGTYRIGLIDGSFQIEGPIKKGCTSFNFGIRRTWLDFLLKPALAIANHYNKEEKVNLGYAFHDINGKVTHVFNDRSKIYLSLYSGNDALTVKDKDREETTRQMTYRDDTENVFSWGNFNVALNWNYIFTPRLFANFSAIYSHNHAKFSNLEDSRTEKDGQFVGYLSHTEHTYRSTIYDFGYRSAFDYRPVPRHHIRFGHDYIVHLFRPQTRSQLNFYGQVGSVDTLSSAGSNRHTAHELSVYAEDEVTLTDHWSAEAGLNAALFHINGKSFTCVDPRLAVKYQVNPRLSLKASYTMMTQFVHRISNSYLNLPTDYWVPTTLRLQSMRSLQVAAGAYAQLSPRLFVSLEGYYKRSAHLLQYSSWMGLEPSADKWDRNVMEGKGVGYGVEADLQYRSPCLDINASYTLSWNKRRFNDFYPSWYFDKFDNRHKFDIVVRYKFTPKISAYAAWTYHSGNRITLPTQYAAMPDVPDGLGRAREGGFVYSHPNNVSMPAYHRLDLGFDFHHTTKKGHERIWNVSIYNAYWHLNPLFVDVKLRENKTFNVRTKGFIPLIPSISYTIKF